jgi:hypothetical protein
MISDRLEPQTRQHKHRVITSPLKKGSLEMRSIRALVGIAAATLLALANASPGSAKTIHKSAPTGQERSVNRSADGTITLEGRYTSPNRHCLEAKRWTKLSDGNYHNGFDAVLIFSDGIEGASPPDGGWLLPVSPAGRSPYVWKAVWPGSALVTVRTKAGYIKEPVSAATSLKFYYWLPSSIGSSRAPYETSYKEHGNTIELTCGVKSSDHNWTYPL